MKDKMPMGTKMASPKDKPARTKGRKAKRGGR